MTTTESGLEVELRYALQRSLRCALEEVLALPRGRGTTRWTHGDLVEALARSRRAIDAVRLYASEYGELTGSVSFSVSSLRGATYALGMCDQLDEEVNLVHDDLVFYSN